MMLRILTILTTMLLLLVTATSAQDDESKIDFVPSIRKLSLGLLTAPLPPSTSLLGGVDLDLVTLGHERPSIGIRVEVEHRRREILSGDGAGAKVKDYFTFLSLRLSDRRESMGVDIYVGFVSPGRHRSYMLGMDVHFFRIDQYFSVFGRFAMSTETLQHNRLIPDPGIGLGISVGYHE